MARPRWCLHAEAVTWRFLMRIGLRLHMLAAPQPASYSFIRNIKTTISPQPGSIDLYFYVPPDYYERPARERYPVVVNFHGGGWTIGEPTDDARFASAVLKYTSAIFVSVDYRLAPEHPFPTSTDDGVDAILWIVKNADDLGIDPTQIITSGFSAGGSLAITVPLKLQEHMKVAGIPPGLETTGESNDIEEVTNLDLKSIIAFYPPTDFTKTRAERHATNMRPDMALSTMFTELFDSCYLYPPEVAKVSSPYLSPGVADAELLSHLPENITIVTCEGDDLRDEGVRFVKRLRSELKKDVLHVDVPGVPHAFDRSPNPFSVHPLVQSTYREVLMKMNEILTKS